MKISEGIARCEGKTWSLVRITSNGWQTTTEVIPARDPAMSGAANKSCPIPLGTSRNSVQWTMVPGESQ